MRLLICLLLVVTGWTQTGMLRVQRRAAAAGCQSGYTHCASLTAGSVTGTLTNFPVLVDVTLGAGKINNASCYDVAFSSDKAGSTPLAWELEPALCDVSTGHIAAWVNDTILTGTVFWIQYGGSQSTFQSTASSAWDTNYKSVWHMPNGSVLTATDSTVNGNNCTMQHQATTNPAAAAGTIDGAASFVIDDSYMTCGTGIDITGTDLTVEAWLKGSQVGAFGQLFDNGVGGVGGVTIALGIAPASSGQWKLTKFGVADITGGTFPSDTNWHHVAVVYSSSGQVVYVDGSSTGGASDTAAIRTNAGATTYIGSSNVDSTKSGIGTYDELRVSNAARSAAWVAASYANQLAPGTFLTKGTEQ